MKIKGCFVIVLITLISELPLYASEETHSTWGLLDPIGRWINLLIIVAGLTYFLRQPAAAFFHKRKVTLQTKIKQAENARRKAEAKLAQAEHRMKKLDDETKRIRQDAQDEAEREKERIREQSAKEVERILVSARREIDNLSQSVRKDLKEYAAEIAVQMASSHLRKQIDSEIDSKLSKQFLGYLDTRSQKN
mgnify:FL=1